MLIPLTIFAVVSLYAMEDELSNKSYTFERLQALQAQDPILNELKEKTENNELQQEKLNYLKNMIGNLPAKYEKLKEFDFGQFGVNVINNGETILCTALLMGCHQIARLLITVGANVNQPTRDEMNTPLMYSVRGCPVDITRLLLQHGADIKAENIYGHTALVRALWYYWMLRWPNGERENIYDLGEITNQRLIIKEICNGNIELFNAALRKLSKMFKVSELKEMVCDLWKKDRLNQQIIFDPTILNSNFCEQMKVQKRTYHRSAISKNN